MLELEHVRKSYSSLSETIRAVDDVSLSVAAQELVAIFGPSGSGKTTLLSLTAALLRPDSGVVRFDGTEVSSLRKREALSYRRAMIGIVFQGFNLTAGLSAEENVALPLLLRKVARREAMTRARVALVDVGLEHRVDHTPDRLSGGEQQRVAVARALVGDPKLLLADEPTGNLDSATGEEVLTLMSALVRERGAAAIIVTHDSGVARFTDRVLRMRDGKVVADHVARTHPSPITE